MLPRSELKFELLSGSVAATVADILLRTSTDRDGIGRGGAGDGRRGEGASEGKLREFS